MGSSSTVREIVVLEAHRIIQAAVDDMLNKLRAGVQEGSIAYPPGATISPREVKSLAAACGLEDEALAGIRALVTDACASALFQLFALLDGVADPEVSLTDEWLGADLVAIDDDEDREMLHDAFFETWWKFHERAGRT